MNRRTLLFLIPGLLSGAVVRAAPAWPADGAVRFEFEVKQKPSDACAGVLAVVPNGGILPPNGGCLVQDDAGNALKNECVWANPREGLAVVFEEPKQGNRVWITFANTGVLNIPRGPSAFCAGPFLYVESRQGQLGEAKLVAKDSPPGKNARFTPVDFIGQQENLLGSDDHYLSYYSAWIKPPKPGAKYYLATISDEGSELHVDGKLLVAWPGVHDRKAGRHGEFGKEIDLDQPRHRLEYFHFEQGGPQECNVVWRGDGINASGGLPVTIEAARYTRTGRAECAGFEGKDGRPVAACQAVPLKYFWFGDRPLNVFKLSVWKARNAPAGATASWALPNGGRLEGDEILWASEGEAPFEVQLTLTAGPLKSVTRSPVVLERAPGSAAVESAADRQLFRDTLLARCRSVTAPKRPAQDWSRDLWAVAANVFEPYEGLDLLKELFTRSRADMAALSPEDRVRFEDLFMLALRRAEPRAALEWAERFQKEDGGNARRFHWGLTRAELLLYELGQPAESRRVLATLQDAANAAGGEAPVRLLVRQGDIDRLEGQRDAARKWYLSAEERHQQVRRGQGPVAARERGAVQPAGRAEDWRSDAVQAATYYKEVKDLVGKGYLFEARGVLDEWEVQFPLSKLSGEYAGADAEFSMHTGDFARAARVLRAYRNSVDITNFLPEAMAMELTCLQQLKRGDDARALAADMVKRFPTHPVAARARAVLGK